VSWSELMSEWQREPAAALDATAEDAVIAAGRHVWHRARDDVRWSRLEAADGLIAALDAYDAIYAGVIWPSAYWPDLEHDPEPYDAGLCRAADAVLHQIAEVIRAAPELAGDVP
jgi:hypothetical protein